MTVRAGAVTAVLVAGVVVAGALLTGCGSAAGDARPDARSTTPPTASASPSGATGSAPAAGTPVPPASASASVTGSPGAGPGSTSVAPTDPDDVDVTVPVGAPSTRPPVAIGAAATTTGATVRVTGAEAVTGEARGPGQVAGPAVRLTVSVTNTGSGPLSLDTATVDLRDATGASATALPGPGARPAAGSLAPGATGDAVYVFGLPASDRTGVTLLVGLAAGTPVVVLRGDLPS